MCICVCNMCVIAHSGCSMHHVHVMSHDPKVVHAHVHTSLLHDIVHWTGHGCQGAGRIAQNQLYLLKLSVFWFTLLKRDWQQDEVSESQGEYMYHCWGLYAEMPTLHSSKIYSLPTIIIMVMWAYVNARCSHFISIYILYV